jgi:heterodisulfide reductase subunit D
VSCPLEIDHAAFVIEQRSQLDIANEKHEIIRDSYVKHGNVYGDSHDHRSDWLRGEQASKFHVVDRGSVAYFTGCTAAYRSPETAVSTLNLLSRLVPEGIVVLGDAEECCGGPLVRVGQGLQAGVANRIREMVQRLVQRGVKRVVFSCPGCYSAAVEYWPRMLGENLPFEAVHVVEFVANAVRGGLVRFNEMASTVTYHDPCHLGRQLGIYDAPREILAAMPGVRFIEMEHIRERARCCGAGGGVRSALPSVTSAIAARRVEEARRTGASTVITSCVFCMQAIRKAIEESRTPMKCLDIIEMLSMIIVPDSNSKKAGGSL